MENLTGMDLQETYRKEEKNILIRKRLSRYQDVKPDPVALF